LVHSNGSVEMDAQWYPNDKEGELKKQGHVVKNWKNRWFILKDNNFYYFKKKGRSKTDRRNPSQWSRHKNRHED